MDLRCQLYYVLEEYIAGNYDTVTFCYTFFNLFYPDRPKDKLTESEFVQFEKLAKATSRFSPYDEDFKNYPNAYISAKEIEKIAMETYGALKK